MSFGERLLNIRKKKKITREELAKLLEYSPKTVAAYENGQNTPNYDMFIKICNIFDSDANYFMQDDLDCTEYKMNPEDEELLSKYRHLSPHDKSIVDYILNMENISEVKKPKVIYIEKSVIPVRMKLQSISAGYGEIIDDTSEYKENFPVNIVPSNTSYGIRVNGDSMEPTIMNGQIIWVEERKDRLPNGSIGVFNTEYGQVCKTFYQDGVGGTITLVSKNSNYKNIIIDNPNFSDIMQGKVIGWCNDPKKEKTSI